MKFAADSANCKKVETAARYGQFRLGGAKARLGIYFRGSGKAKDVWVM
jgi:hypothetical protein